MILTGHSPVKQRLQMTKIAKTNGQSHLRPCLLSGFERMSSMKTGLRLLRPENSAAESARSRVKRRTYALICRNCEGNALRTRLILRISENEPVRFRLVGGERGIRTLDTGLIRITP